MRSIIRNTNFAFLGNRSGVASVSSSELGLSAASYSRQTLETNALLWTPWVPDYPLNNSSMVPEQNNGRQWTKTERKPSRAEENRTELDKIAQKKSSTGHTAL